MTTGIGIWPKRTPVRRKRLGKPRRGPMRDKGYRDWLKYEYCAIGEAHGSEGCTGVTDPAHTENNGMGSKGPDSSCGPLCRRHHREYDAGRVAFEKKYRVSMKLIAAQNWARYEQEKAA